jgi:hypothetical protein
VFASADDPVELTLLNSGDVMRITEKPLTDLTAWEFPAASVSAIALTLTKEGQKS